MPDFKVNLVAALQGTAGQDYSFEDSAVYGALGCFEEKSALELFEKDRTELAPEKREQKRERMFRETAGRGHGAVTDQSCFTFVLEDVPRLVTLQLCAPQYLMHLQQSLRRAKADRGFYLPEIIKNSEFFTEVKTLLEATFVLYEEMSAEDPVTKKNIIPGEDARFILPLYTKTNIQTTGDAREFFHLHQMSRGPEMPTIIREVVEEIVHQLKQVAPLLFKDRGTNYEVLAWYPSSQLFARENLTLQKLIQAQQSKEEVILLNASGLQLSAEGVKRAIEERREEELANLKHLHYTFLTKMSLACFHQATRQRTWDQSVESIYAAARRGEFVTPPSILKNEKYKILYEELNQKILKLYEKLIGNGIPEQEAIGILPHALVVYDLIHVNGWNAIHSIGKRTCTTAQWEIRAIANQMAESIRKHDPVLGQYVQPQGIVYGKCPERENCGYCEAFLKKKQNEK